MKSVTETTYVVNLDFETIKLPPVSDILVLGKKVPQGKIGVLHSFELISPDVFELLEIEHPNIEGVIINKNLLAKIPEKEILEILSAYVFPYISKGESVRVNFNIQIFQRNIKGEIDAGEVLPTERGKGCRSVHEHSVN